MIVQPAGTVQTYSVAPPTGITGGSAATEKICPVAFTHTSEGPEIGPGVLSSLLIVRVTIVAGPIHCCPVTD